MTRRLPPARLLAAAVAGMAGLTAWVLNGDARPRSVLLALRHEEVSALARRSSAAPEDLWERARAIGVSAAELRPRRLGELLADGEALFFTASEAAKWELAGLVAPGSPLKRGSLWVRDADVHARLAEALRGRGIAFSTHSYSGFSILDLPAGLDVAGFPVGYDPRELREVRAQGLIPVEAARAGENRAVEELRPFAGGPLLAFPLRLSSGMAPVRRAVAGRGARLLWLRLDPELGPEENMDLLRRLASGLRDAGYPPGPPPPAGPAAGGRSARRALALLAAILGPLWAMRQGLRAVRGAAGCQTCPRRWPEAYPVPELAAGVLCVAGIASGLGLAAYALLAFPEWRLGLDGGARWWGLWTAAAPLALSAAALYSDELGGLARRLKRPVLYREVLALAAGSAGLWLLSRPGGFELPWESLWWLPERWREMLVGYPCLVAGLWLHLEGQSEEPQEKDPRPWLLLGLLGPAGTLHAFGLARGEWAGLLAQTAAGVALGAVLGGVLAGLLARRRAAAPKKE